MAMVSMQGKERMNFLAAERGGIAVEGGLNVCLQQIADDRQRA
jgi:hypothetical protein